jgi:hypothetical protein
MPLWASRRKRIAACIGAELADFRTLVNRVAPEQLAADANRRRLPRSQASVLPVGGRAVAASRCRAGAPCVAI